MTKKMGAPLEFSQSGNIVADTRRKLNISQAELAGMLKITHGAISQFENGKRKISGTVEVLCKVLQHDPSILLKLS